MRFVAGTDALLVCGQLYAQDKWDTIYQKVSREIFDFTGSDPPVECRSVA
jgi:hypothetical protein